MNYKLNDLTLDKSSTPLWAEKIKRWSQLDEASFILAEAVSRNAEFLSQSFDQLILVSTQGSNHTDRLFVTDAKISPSNFVHTLPNVRSIVFSILTGWEGPLYCFSRGSETLVSTLKEISIAHQEQKTMVVSLNKISDQYQCDFYLVGKNEKYPEFLADDFSFREKLAAQGK